MGRWNFLTPQQSNYRTAKMTPMSQNMSTALVANNLPIPSALGSLDAYIGAVHQIPVL